MRLRQLFIVGIFFFVTHAVWAQGFSFGVKTGIDLVRISAHLNSSDRLGHPDPAIGFNINAIIEYRMANKFGVTMEPGYIRKGYSKALSHSGDADNVVKLNYLQVPILLDYHVTEKLAISIGPEIGFSLSDSYFRRKKVDLSAVLGVNYRLAEHFEAGLKIGSAITPSYQAKPTSTLTYTEYNQYAQVSIAYRF